MLSEIKRISTRRKYESRRIEYFPGFAGVTWIFKRSENFQDDIERCNKENSHDYSAPDNFKETEEECSCYRGNNPCKGKPVDLCLAQDLRQAWDAGIPVLLSVFQNKKPEVRDLPYKKEKFKKYDWLVSNATSCCHPSDKRRQSTGNCAGNNCKGSDPF